VELSQGGRVDRKVDRQGEEQAERLGHSRKVPRPHHAKADKREQEEAFKIGYR